MHMERGHADVIATLKAMRESREEADRRVEAKLWRQDVLGLVRTAVIVGAVWLFSGDPGELVRVLRGMLE